MFSECDSLDNSLRFTAQDFVLFWGFLITSVNLETLIATEKDTNFKNPYKISRSLLAMSMLSLSEKGPKTPEFSRFKGWTPRSDKVWVQDFVMANISFIAIYQFFLYSSK